MDEYSVNPVCELFIRRISRTKVKTDADFAIMRKLFV